MKERIYSIVSTISGPTTTGISIESIMSKTTPIITWLGLIMGLLLTTIMTIYWIKKLFNRVKK